MKLADYLKKIDLYDQVIEGVKNFCRTNTNLFYMIVACIEYCEFKFITRSNQLAGTCKGISLIRLHEKVAQRPDDRKDTLLHEIGHLIRNCERKFYGESRFESMGRIRKRRSIHGREWKSIVIAIGGSAETCHNYDYLKGNPSEYKHKYTCKDCGYEHFIYRRLKNMDVRYHRGCRHKPNGGHFTHTQLR